MTHILAFRFIGANFDKPEGRKFHSKRSALQVANDWFFPSDANALAEQTVAAPTAQMVKLYNSLAATPVKKFTDRKTAAERLWKLIEEQNMETIDIDSLPDNISGQMAEAAAKQAAANAERAAAAAAKKEAAAKAKAEREATRAAKKEAATAAKAEKEAARAARKEAAAAAKAAAKVPRSKIEGKTLVPTYKDAEGNLANPRKVGTFGWNSYNIVLAAGADGISVADFKAAGGRLVDANWDIDHGYMVAQ